jgi:hypothetical protein
MPNEFVMRGQTADFKTTAAFEVLNFSGYKPGYAYRLVEFVLAPSAMNTDFECCGIITAGKTVKDPEAPDFNDDSIIATGFMGTSASQPYPVKLQFIVNDTFLITQNLLLSVSDTASSPNPINWQCRFVAEKMSGPQEAVTNYKQFQISDGS